MQRHVTKPLAQLSILLLAAVLALFSACDSAGIESLAGEYSPTEGGQAELRVTRVGGEFFLSALEGGKWSRPEKLVECSEKDYEQVFGPDWQGLNVRGLRASDFGLFTVKKGAVSQGHTFKTGYFMFFLVGQDVYRL